MLLVPLQKTSPQRQRELLEKANRAILKAGEHKEVRIGLGRLFKAKR